MITGPFLNAYEMSCSQYDMANQFINIKLKYNAKLMHTSYHWYDVQICYTDICFPKPCSFSNSCLYVSKKKQNKKQKTKIKNKTKKENKNKTAKQKKNKNKNKITTKKNNIREKK